ncbi:hypothetical protein PIB30_071346 [Stylosanthes scabra]|uniref:VQ domain-containing protein n=1 Tax=Stylosanthes scabra TaxID=79078 RepID=A0ABU6VN83_9FABA|nr:hypothetical protein [Stylosanthes scabra]
MDSANSSGSMSMQSSSGADEEYDSRAHAPSSLLLSSPYITNTLPLPHPPPQHHHMFLQDPLLSNYLDPMQTSDIMWSKPNHNNNQSDLLGSFILPSSSSQQQGGGGGGGGAAVATTHGQNQEVPAAPCRGVSNNNIPNNRVVRNNPKKRSRASRRAPTTVLTTDTTNFRAMVQEFTGIPPPPFTSSPFPRTRFDLFAAASSSLMDPSPPPPPYLLRPFPQRLLHHPLPPPPPYSNNNNNSILDNLFPSNNSTTAINFQQPAISSSSSLGTGGDVLLKHNPLNPAILNFQNVLQQQQAPPPKYLSSDHDAVASKAQASSLEIPPPINSGEVGVFEELGLGEAHLNKNVNASGVHLHHHENKTNGPSREEWAQRTATLITNNDCEGGREREGENSGGGAKVPQQQHYSSPSSDFLRGENTTKGADQCTVVAAPPRTSQGMLESWINCSSHHNLS